MIDLHKNGIMPRSIIDPSTGQPFRSDDDFDLPPIFSTATIIQSGWQTYLQNWDEAMKHRRENALAMRRDPTIMGLLRERKEATINRSWRFEVESPQDPWEKAAQVIMTHSFRRIPEFKQIQRWALEDIWYGKYGVHFKYEWQMMRVPRPMAPMPGAMTVRDRVQPVLTVAKARPVNGDKIGFDFDGTPCVEINPMAQKSFPKHLHTMVTEAPAILLKDSLRERFLITQHDPDDSDYFDSERLMGIHGVGVRDRLYWLWWMMQEYDSWVASMLERWGMGVVIIYYDAANKDSYNIAVKAAKGYNRRHGALLMPRSSDGSKLGGSVEVVEMPVGSAEIVLQLKRHLEDKEERFIIGQTMSSGINDSRASGMGGYGWADMAEATKHQLTAADTETLDEQITGSAHKPGLAWLIKKWSIPWADFPCRFVHEILDPNRAGVIDGICKLAALPQPVSFPTEAVRGLTGVRAPAPGEETIGLPVMVGPDGLPLPPGAEGGGPQFGEDEQSPPFEKAPGDIQAKEEAQKK